MHLNLVGAAGNAKATTAQKGIHDYCTRVTFSLPLVLLGLSWILGLVQGNVCSDFIFSRCTIFPSYKPVRNLFCQGKIKTTFFLYCPKELELANSPPIGPYKGTISPLC